MKAEHLQPVQGNVLISEPFLSDFYFRRSVVLLAEHNDDGSFGLIINKPLDVKINEIVKEFPFIDANLYLGGPLGTDSLYILHSLGNKIDKSIKISQGLYWGGNIDTIKTLIEEKEITNKQIRFYIGYSGWDPKQLNKELDQNAWVVSPFKSKSIFHETADHLWKDLLKTMGKDYALWVNYPVDPTMN